MDPPSPLSGKNFCSICLNNECNQMMAVIAMCNHEFCYTCIRRWSETSRNCPICRASYWTLVVKIDRQHENNRSTMVHLNPLTSSQEEEEDIDYDDYSEFEQTYDEVEMSPNIIFDCFGDTVVRRIIRLLADVPLRTMVNRLKVSFGSVCCSSSDHQ